MLALVAALLAPGPPAEASVWPSSHERVARALDSSDPGERRAAAAELQRLPPRLAGRLARQALLDQDVEVRLHAARAAAGLGLPDAGDLVIGWLSESDPRLRQSACELIDASPTAASVQALGRVLGDTSPAVRRAAAIAMGSSGLSDAVPALLGHLDDGALPVRTEVVRALGRIGDARAVVPLGSRLQDPEPGVRRAAARALGELGDAHAVATLVLALQDSSAEVCIEALGALGRLRADEATAPIAALLAGHEAGAPEPPGSSDAGPVREAAWRALAQIGGPQAIRLLVEALEREGPVLAARPRQPGTAPPVRRALALAGTGAVAALAEVLRAPASVRLASAAALALGEMGAPQARPLIVAAAERGGVSLQAALAALAELGDPGALPFVLEHLDHPDLAVRAAAIATATQLLDPARRDGRAVDPAGPRLTDPLLPLSEKLALSELLGRTGSARAEPILLGLVRARSPALRQAAVEALGTLGQSSPAIDRALLEALSGSSDSLRWAAAVALGKVGGEAAAAVLLGRIEVSAEQDRAALGIALSGAASHSRDPQLVRRMRGSLAALPASARDAAIEALGRVPLAEAERLLAELARAPDADDRRKVAEALGGHRDGHAALLSLLGDPDPGVRANAAWSLGRVGAASTLGPLRAALADMDTTVSGNAAVALGRIAARTGRAAEVAGGLCRALSDYRSYVRMGALAGLRLVEDAAATPPPGSGAAGAAPCEPVALRQVLGRDPSWHVRLAAARLLGRRAERQLASELDRRALARCAAEDRDATVAALCARPAAAPQPPLAPATRAVLVYVVPDGRTDPQPRAPYALVRADGTIRLGVADRRGALFEGDAPDGPIELAVPAALAP